MIEREQNTSSLVVIMPMLGNGQRFIDAGFKEPKPLIRPTVGADTILAYSIKSLPIERVNKWIFIIREDTRDEVKKEIDSMNLSKDGLVEVVIISSSSKTRGMAETVKMAQPYLEQYDEVIVSSCDQAFITDWNNFLNVANLLGDFSGVCLTFKEEEGSPKWSFCKERNGLIDRVEEKVRISNFANVGVYYWKRAWVMFDAIDEMVRKDIRTNGEFYMAPVYNELLEKYSLNGPYSRNILLAWNVSTMVPLGTPEDIDKNGFWMVIFKQPII